MTFCAKKVVYGNGESTEIIQFEVDEDIKSDALDIAKRKAPYTMKWSVGDYERDSKKQLYNLWQGKIADKKTMQWLESNGFQIEEYDQVRMNNFKNPDPWDLRVVSSNIEIEVRSSCIAKPNHDLSYVISSYKLLGPYRIPGFKDSERDKYLHIQIIYPYIQNSLNQELEKRSKVQGYMVGWITRGDLFKRGFDWSYRETRYKVVVIKDSCKMSELAKFLPDAKSS